MAAVRHSFGRPALCRRIGALYLELQAPPGTSVTAYVLANALQPTMRYRAASVTSSVPKSP